MTQQSDCVKNRSKFDVLGPSYWLVRLASGLVGLTSKSNRVTMHIVFREYAYPVLVTLL